MKEECLALRRAAGISYPRQKNGMRALPQKRVEQNPLY